MLPAIEQWPSGLNGRLHECRKLRGLPPQAQNAPSNSRDIEQIVEQQGHVLHLSLDHVVAPLPRYRWDTRPVGYGGSLPDGRERIAQLVCERCLMSGGKSPEHLPTYVRNNALSQTCRVKAHPLGVAV